MRRIICTECGQREWYQRLHPADAAAGFKFRRTDIAHARKPDDHYVTINGVRQPPLPTLLCDDCCRPIPDGEPCVAITQWRGGEMGDWEREYTQP